MKVVNCGFKAGDKVYHVRGGRGEVRSFENDWSTNPPTVIAVVRVLDTSFHDIRRIPVEDLRLERRTE
jgi:hypothetical protein